LLWLFIYLIQYQEDQAHHGIVFDSLFAGFQQSGHVVLIRSSILAKGHFSVHVGS
jgi:hypothetical protein